MDLEILKKARDAARQIQETDIQTYILKNQKKMDAQFLRLVADQWIARQKVRYKLPHWFANPDIIYPAPLSVEQASSMITAGYKAKIFFDSNYTTLVDLTGGMGIDTIAFADLYNRVTYVEKNEHLVSIARHNFEVTGYNNIKVRNEDALSFLLNNPIGADTHCYIDPARRDSAKNRVFRIEDCEPNLLNVRQLLGDFMVKYSPMLDIKHAIDQLQPISEVHIVAVENEVKELLLTKVRDKEETKIICVNFLPDSTRQTFSFNYSQEHQLSIAYSLPKQYVYEPNAAILKAGGFKSVAYIYNLEKLAPNSHLYTSDTFLRDFPGRSFICEAVCKFDKKEILSRLPGNQANISTRNFPMKPEEIKKKLDIKDGGDVYLFATENHHQQKIVLICRKAAMVDT
jgi:hypothetical protein